jgi:hypothetical protein
VRTNLFEVGVLMWFSKFTGTKAANFAYRGALVLLFLLREHSGVTGEHFLNAIFTKTKRDDWVPTGINLTMQGENLDLLGSMRASFTPPVKMEAYFVGTLMAVLSIRSRLDGTTC